jgi:precorrin-3B synthase
MGDEAQLDGGDSRQHEGRAAMTASAAIFKGWCPGALRPMESGDGLIVRLKITGGILTTQLAAEIARWSRHWGNGQIDITSRANLQIRGVAMDGIPHLQDAIAAWGLLDASPEAEAVRNVIASPLAGLDPDFLLDIRPMVERLERCLVEDDALHALPGKFGFAIDDGGRFGLDGVAADIWFKARRTDEGVAFDIRLDGASAVCLAACRPEALSDTAASLAIAFIRARRNTTDIRRMRDWVRLAGVETIKSLLIPSSPRRREPTPPPAQVESWIPAVAGTTNKDEVASKYLGIHSLGFRAFVGVGLPFGWIPADEFADLAIAVEQHGGTELRLTPWRAILIPLPSIEAAQALADRISLAPAGRGWREAPGFILDPRDPLLRVAACVGAPACARAMTDVRGDAVRIASALPETITLHVSGCAKGCAHPKAAAITLVGQNGRYALVRDGAPWDRAVRENLTVEEAVRLISAQGGEP